MKKITTDFRAKKQYLIIGNDNFWYGSCMKSIKEVKEKLKHIKENIKWYGQSEVPPILYIYEAKEIGQEIIGD